MELKIDERQVIENAWKMYLENYSKGWSWKDVYNTAEVEARNEAILLFRKEQYDLKRKAEIEKEEAKFSASGMDIHTYTMTNYYNSNGYQGD